MSAAITDGKLCISAIINNVSVPHKRMEIDESSLLRVVIFYSYILKYISYSV